MVSLSRSKKPFSASIADYSENYSFEYSFAEEYRGPPVSYDIPDVDPIDFRRISTAYLVSSASSLDEMAIPVIQPILKTGNGNKEFSSKNKTSAMVVRSPVSGRNSTGELHDSGRIFPCNAVEESPEVLKNDDEHPEETSEGSRNSGNGEFQNNQVQNEVSGNSDTDDVQGNSEIVVNSSRDVPNLKSEIVELGLSSSEVIEDSSAIASNKGKRTTLVTFRDHIESDKTPERGSLDVMTKMIERPVLRTDAKKGLCYRCNKGNRLTEKETCIVCGAKYCRNCLLRAMGSMQEGRKCITCIGFRIDESNRAFLGKSSRMLKKLLTNWEVKQIMRAELSCAANQLSPDLVFVNGRHLSLREITALQSCRYPPKKLKPGRYWYDRVSGFWGKEGHKPRQIITPSLDVGDAIKKDASNGNTNILINNREITKIELWMLQMAGVNIEGNTHFWMSADGSFQEEGQQIVREKLWNKSRVKLISAALSLPIPPQYFIENAAQNSGEDVSEHLPENFIRKIFLVGCDQSGTSTVYKQAKILYGDPFSEAELQSIKNTIQVNLYQYIAAVLENRLMFEEVCLQELRTQRLSEPGPSVYYEVEENTEYSINQRLKAFSELLIQAKLSSNIETFSSEATEECAQLVEELLNSTGFRAAYNRLNELKSLPEITNYFLDRGVEISKVDYEPSDMDILHADDINSSNGVVSMEFAFPVSSQNDYMESSDDQKDPPMRYQLISVQASNLGQNCKWLQMFEDVDLVVFCVSLTDYNEFNVDINGNSINKMIARKAVLETIITHQSFSNKTFLLLLNKFNLLEQELDRAPLSKCDWFQDFNPVISYHQPSTSSRSINPSRARAQRAFHYIAVRFKRLYSSLTRRKLYVKPVNDLEADNAEEVLKYVGEILKWEEESARFARNSFSSETIDASTTS